MIKTRGTRSFLLFKRFSIMGFKRAFNIDSVLERHFKLHPKDYKNHCQPMLTGSKRPLSTRLDYKRPLFIKSYSTECKRPLFHQLDYKRPLSTRLDYKRPLFIKSYSTRHSNLDVESSESIKKLLSQIDLKCDWSTMEKQRSEFKKKLADESIWLKQQNEAIFYQTQLSHIEVKHIHLATII